MILDGRFERKIVIAVPDAKLIESYLKAKIVGIHSPFPERKINNFYFDSFDFQAARQNIDGIDMRSKMRLRWYGDSLSESTDCFLERKQKKANIVFKEVIGVGAMPVAALSDVSQVNRWLLSKEVPTYFKDWLRGQSIVCYNSYSRKYFVSLTGNVRLTIDFGIKTTPLSFLHINASRLRSFLKNHHHQTVLEIKYPIDCEPEAQAIMSRLSVPVTKFSKYVAGLV